MKRRIKAIDMAKGIGMLYIMMSHSGYLFPAAEYFYWMYVPIFFVCSGLTFHESNIREELSGLVKRLIIPMIVFRVCGIMIGSLCDIATGRFGVETVGVALRDALYGRYSLYPLGTSENVYFTKYMLNEWFLPALFLASVLFVLIKRGQRWYSGRAYYFIVIIVLTLLSIGFSKLPVLLPWSLDTIPTCTIFMIIGYLLKDIGYMYKKIVITDWVLAIPMCIVFVLIVKYNTVINLSVRVYGEHGILSVPIYIFNASLCCFLILFFCKVLERIRLFHILAYIGKATLIMYLCHSSVFVLVDAISGGAEAMGLSLGIYATLKLLIAIVVTLLINEVCGRYRIVKREKK